MVYAATDFIVLFFLEVMGIADIPFSEIPDYFSGKAELLQKTGDGLNELK